MSPETATILADLVVLALKFADEAAGEGIHFDGLDPAEFLIDAYDLLDISSDIGSLAEMVRVAVLSGAQREPGSGGYEPPLDAARRAGEEFGANFPGALRGALGDVAVAGAKAALSFISMSNDKHDERVTELLEANNAEVERRRQQTRRAEAAEDKVDGLESDLDSALDVICRRIAGKADMASAYDWLAANYPPRAKRLQRPPEASDGLKQRCFELIQWHKTGIRSGLALEVFANDHCPADITDSLDRLTWAERQTKLEALHIVAGIAKEA